MYNLINNKRNLEFLCETFSEFSIQIWIIYVIIQFIFIISNGAKFGNRRANKETLESILIYDLDICDDRAKSDDRCVDCDDWPFSTRTRRRSSHNYASPVPTLSRYNPEAMADRHNILKEKKYFSLIIHHRAFIQFSANFSLYLIEII